MEAAAYYGGLVATRRAQPRFTAATREVITGSPIERRISASWVERQNLSMRMGMRPDHAFTIGEIVTLLDAARVAEAA